MGSSTQLGGAFVEAPYPVAEEYKSSGASE